jgi:glycerophosphoryl diester phosphodiesterase
MATAFLDAPGPLAFAHRGGAAHAPENSWRAFEHAVGLGYWYLETDLQATADGVLIAFHDRTLTRVTGVGGRVSRFRYADLSGALVSGTEPIPVLEDLLAAWPDVRFNLDVKDVSAIAPLPEVLRRTNAWDRVCVVSFSASRLRATRRALGRPVCMAASPLGTAVVRLGAPRGRRPPGGSGGPPPRASTGHRPAGPRGAGPAGQQRQWPLTDWLTRTGVRCVQVPAQMATAPFIRRAHALGLQVHVWTVNDRPAMERMLDLGADGIMTDETVALREVLSARNQWHPRMGSGRQ